jgi:hydroxymethylpyrimidine pyrophosphatase-like HAD family hydrolase
MSPPARDASKISLVLADVDGTLVTVEKVLTSRARAPVKALQAAGIDFAITSGRPPARDGDVDRRHRDGEC